MALERYSWISSYRYSLERYDKSAINVYQKIYNYLDSLGMKHSDSLLFQYNPDDYKHYLGKYDALWCSVKNEVLDDSIIISLEKGKLMYTGYRSVGPDTRMEIIPIGKNAFRDKRYDGGLYHLSYDDLGEVVGIRYGGGPTYTLTMKKIR